MTEKEKLQSLLIITSAINESCMEISKTDPEMATNFGLWAITTLGIAKYLDDINITNFKDNLMFYENNLIIKPKTK